MPNGNQNATSGLCAGVDPLIRRPYSYRDAACIKALPIGRNDNSLLRCIIATRRRIQMAPALHCRPISYSESTEHSSQGL